MVALVLIGLATHAEEVLAGAQLEFRRSPNAVRQKLYQRLHPIAGPPTYHRDGLLFEIISWIAARLTMESGDLISTPHLSSTQQGLDTLKVSFDPANRSLLRAVIYEQKCTDYPRKEFREKVIPAFAAWRAHERDNQLVQAVTALVARYGLNNAERLQLYDRIVQDHPLEFQAALTVSPPPFDTTNCVSLFDGYADVTPDITHRRGDTFPLHNIRGWFADFAAKVWVKIEEANV